MLYIAPVVEGISEKNCLPGLLTRIWYEPSFMQPHQQPMDPLEPISCSGGSSLRSSEWFLQSRVEMANRKLAARITNPELQRGAILILLDADNDCP